MIKPCLLVFVWTKAFGFLGRDVHMTTTLTRINELLKGGNLEEAQRELDAIPSDGVDPAERRLASGKILERQGRWQEAANAYESILEEDEDHTEAAFRLAYLADRHGDDETAIELYERCVAETPAPVSALLNLSVLYEDAERYGEALVCLDRVLEEHPNHTRARQFQEDVEGAFDMYYDEEQQRLRDKRNAILETPVSDFELSVRSRNCLKQMDIHVLGDLLRTTEAELLTYKNFGETSLSEINAMLTQKGLRLGQLLDEPPSQGDGSELDGAVGGGKPPEAFRSVAELKLSVRSRKCLLRLGINTIGELTIRSEAELLAIKNFGMTSLLEIKQQLAETGLALRDD